MTSLGLRDEIEDVPQRSAKLREFDEDDFSSDDEEIEVDIEFESNDEQPLVFSSSPTRLKQSSHLI